MLTWVSRELIRTRLLVWFLLTSSCPWARVSWAVAVGPAHAGHCHLAALCVCSRVSVLMSCSVSHSKHTQHCQVVVTAMLIPLVGGSLRWISGMGNGKVPLGRAPRKWGEVLGLGLVSHESDSTVSGQVQIQVGL